MTKCVSCGREGLKPYGFGTEKLEQTISEFFPNARVARMDTDSTQRKGKALQILKRFSDREIDILVGTQMITKGYDFPAVTLVGIVAADLSLGFPDFRAGERTFQLLSQVAGRAGRGSGKGRVIIQAFNPEHYAIGTATTYDYRAFFEKEKELREQLRYPPYSYLACLRISGDHEAETAEAARALGQSIQQILRQWTKRRKEISMLGPAKAAIHRLKGKYRWQILLKSRSAALLHHLLRKLDKPARKALQSRGVHFIVDVDPYQMI
jgi:primosomal protein N' (replication factor Y)